MRCTLRIGSLISIGRLVFERFLRVIDQLVIERFVEAVILRLVQRRPTRDGTGGL